MYIVLHCGREPDIMQLVYLAALAGIDMEQYEAARIDGANAFSKDHLYNVARNYADHSDPLIMQMGSLFSSDFQKRFFDVQSFYL